MNETLVIEALEPIRDEVLATKFGFAFPHRGRNSRPGPRSTHP